MKLPHRHIVYLAMLAAFGLWVAVAWPARIEPGQRMGLTFASTLGEMLKLLPCAFLLIALFDVWVKRETVERHLGRGAGLVGYLWCIALAGITVGGLYVAFPVAYSLFRKGARLGIIFAYVGLAGVCRIPMTIFEFSFMGGLFTAVRLAVSIPLAILIGELMGRVLERGRYAITE